MTRTFKGVQSITEIEATEVYRLATGVNVFDSLFGVGNNWDAEAERYQVGMVRGGLYLLGGEAGAGKTKLCTMLMTKIAHEQGLRSLIVEREMMAGSYRGMCENMWRSLPQYPGNTDLLLFPSNVVETVEDLAELIEENEPDLVVVDSLAMLDDCQTKAQIKHFEALMRRACGTKTVGLFIAQLDKRGEVAGLQFLQHMMDSVLDLKKDKNGLISLTMGKNRGGPSGGVVWMRHNGALLDLA